MAARIPTHFQIIGLILALDLSLALAIPGHIHFQGRLTGKTGHPISGDSTVRFQIFDAPTEGRPVGPAFTQTITANDHGLFSADVGPFGDPAVFSEHPDCYLQVEVQAPGGTGFHALVPRQRLASVPFAFLSSHADEAERANSVGADSIGEVQLQFNSITSLKIKDGEVKAVDIATNSVNSLHIVDQSIQAVDLMDNAIDGPKLKEGAVSAREVKNRSLLGIHVATGALTSVEIEDGSLRNVDLADNAVTSDKIKDGEVTGADIRAGTIQGANLSPDLIAQLLPRGIISMFAGACPDGWRHFDKLDSRFPIGTPLYTGNPGGSNVVGGLTLNSAGSHAHTVNSHSHHAGSLTANPLSTRAGYQSVSGTWEVKDNPTIQGDTAATTGQTQTAVNHTHSINSDGTWRPPFLGLVFCEKMN